MMIIIWYLLFKSEDSRVPLWIFIAGILRACALGGIIYIPAVDDHDPHDLCLTIYLSMTFVWFFTLLNVIGTNGNAKSHLYRKRILRWYCILFVPMMHYFTQHRIYQVAGGKCEMVYLHGIKELTSYLAYSKYSIFEWIVIGLDLLYDCVAVFEFDSLEVRVYDTMGVTKSNSIDLNARSHYV